VLAESAESVGVPWLPALVHPLGPHAPIPGAFSFERTEAGRDL